MSLSEIPRRPLLNNDAFKASLDEELQDISDKVQKLAGMTEDFSRLMPIVHELGKENIGGNNLERDQLLAGTDSPMVQMRKLHKDVNEFAESLGLSCQESNEPNQEVEKDEEVQDSDSVPVMDQASVNDKQGDSGKVTMTLEQQPRNCTDEIVKYDDGDMQQNVQTEDHSVSDDLSLSTITSDNDETVNNNNDNDDKAPVETGSGSDESIEEPVSSSLVEMNESSSQGDESAKEDLNVSTQSEPSRRVKAGKRKKSGSSVEPRQSRRIRSMTPDVQVVKGKSRQVRRSMRKVELPVGLTDFII